MATSLGTAPAAGAQAELLGLPPCDQVGFVVRDLERAMALYAPLFGPFHTMDGSVGQAEYRGRLADVELKLAFGRSGDLEVELIEWAGGESPHREFIEAGREGMHHIRYRVDDTDRWIEKLRPLGYEAVWYKRWSADTVFAYLERKGDPTLIEFLQMPPGGPGTAGAPPRDVAATDVVPRMPPRVPRGGNALTRWLGRTLLRLMGWRVAGVLPDEPRVIAIAAPHTSNWDWAVAMPALLALGIRINYLVKDSAFWWPLSVILHATGGVPTNRSAPEGLVEELTARLIETPEIILVITPEGTRKRVEHWKTGFLRIAEGARLPVVQVSWDYPNRVITLGPRAVLTGDHEADVAAIRAYYRQFTGRNPENQSP